MKPQRIDWRFCSRVLGAAAVVLGIVEAFATWPHFQGGELILGGLGFLGLPTVAGKDRE